MTTSQTSSPSRAKRSYKIMAKGKVVDETICYFLPAELSAWAKHHNGHEFIATFKITARMSDKEKMFAYLFGPLLDCALTCYEEAGHEGLDKYDLYYYFKTKYAKEVWLNPITKKEEMRILDMSEKDTPADMLNKFINDIVMELTHEFNAMVPDPTQYLVTKKYGAGFKSMKSKDI